MSRVLLLGNCCRCWHCMGGCEWPPPVVAGCGVGRWPRAAIRWVGWLVGWLVFGVVDWFGWLVRLVGWVVRLVGWLVGRVGVSLCEGLTDPLANNNHE